MISPLNAERYVLRTRFVARLGCQTSPANRFAAPVNAQCPARSARRTPGLCRWLEDGVKPLLIPELPRSRPLGRAWLSYGVPNVKLPSAREDGQDMSDLGASESSSVSSGARLAPDDNLLRPTVRTRLGADRPALSRVPRPATDGEHGLTVGAGPERHDKRVVSGRRSARLRSAGADFARS